MKNKFIVEPRAEDKIIKLMKKREQPMAILEITKKAKVTNGSARRALRYLMSIHTIDSVPTFKHRVYFLKDD
jgi:response regulator of citrate/malate metabolism